MLAAHLNDVKHWRFSGDAKCRRALATNSNGLVTLASDGWQRIRLLEPWMAAPSLAAQRGRSYTSDDRRLKSAAVSASLQHQDDAANTAE
jgi:hypothetical protein